MHTTARIHITQIGKLGFALCLGTLSLGACSNMTAADLQPFTELGTQIAAQKGYGNNAEMVKGLKQMLTLSSSRSSDMLASVDVWKLALPPEGQKMIGTLRSVGLGKYVDNAQTLMNQSAQQAAVAAAPVFKQAIKNMSVTDALSIWKGGSGAATAYFRQQTETQLRSQFAPIIRNSLEKTGFFNSYQTALTAYNAIPLATKPNLDVEGYLLNRSMDAMFTQMAEEETTIRKNPRAAGDALIQMVLGNLAK